MQDEVAIEDSSVLQITAKEAQAAGRSLSLYSINSEAIRKIEQLGIQVQTAGVIKISDGLTFMTAECLANTIVRLSEQAETKEGKELHEYARSLGYLAGQMAKQTKELKRSEAPIPATNSDQIAKSGFRPGAAVQVNVHGNATILEK